MKRVASKTSRVALVAYALLAVLVVTATVSADSQSGGAESKKKTGDFGAVSGILMLAPEVGFGTVAGIMYEEPAAGFGTISGVLHQPPEVPEVSR